MKLFYIFILSIFIDQANGQTNYLYKYIGTNAKYGFMDKNGNIKIKPQFYHVTDFSEGLAFVSRKNKHEGYDWICIDSIGKTVFELNGNFPAHFEYDPRRVSGFHEGFARIYSIDKLKHQTKTWFINKQGLNIFNKTWTWGEGGFIKGVAFVYEKVNGDYLIFKINREGNVLDSFKDDKGAGLAISVLRTIPPADTECCSKSVFWEKNKIGFINCKTKKIITKPKFYSVGLCVNGFIPVRLDSTNVERDRGSGNDFYDAILNPNGEIIYNGIFRNFDDSFIGDLLAFYEGITYTSKPHYINKNGKEILPKE